eukprot:TRINITY_DN168_c0_g6_i2.p1 TRINITY_DN168_c0_g6~~TRINITY_DN168_c0_g6_i2.p1  ORF type:complete len:488 (-),score=77.12 TRINITY_DN168_c0_g6_i2:562-2025(-)
MRKLLTLLSFFSVLAFTSCFSFSRPLAPHRFAYVMIHYEGTNRDDEYLLGLRVLIRSIQETQTKQDIVVLVANNVCESSRQQLLNDGAIVKEVQNIPNPYKYAMEMRRSYKSRFEFTFNKLYLWNMTEYERVIYFDADNLVVANMDDAFMCGHFCVVFMNPINFHTGMLVVKPDTHQFERLLFSLSHLELPSYDGADQGFLTAEFTGAIQAPMFNPSDYEDGRPADAPLMRMPFGYNLNHIYYYAYFSWDRFRLQQAYFTNRALPFLSIGYPIMPIAKPWYWWAVFFFDAHWLWHSVRYNLPDTDLFWFLISRLSVFAFACFICIRVALFISHMDSLLPLRRAGYRLLRMWPWPNVFGYLIGTVATVFSLAIPAIYFVNRLAYPWGGWTMFLLYHWLYLFCTLVIFGWFVRIPERIKYSRSDELESLRSSSSISNSNNNNSASLASTNENDIAVANDTTNPNATDEKDGLLLKIKKAQQQQQQQQQQ